MSLPDAMPIMPTPPSGGSPMPVGLEAAPAGLFDRIMSMFSSDSTPEAEVALPPGFGQASDSPLPILLAELKLPMAEEDMKADALPPVFDLHDDLDIPIPVGPSPLALEPAATDLMTDVPPPPPPVEPDAHAKAIAEAAPLPMPMEPVQRTKAKADASEPITPRSPTVSSAPTDAADSETTVAATLDMPRHKKAKPQSSPPPADKPVATTDTPATIAAAKDTQAAAPISAKALPTAAARPTAEDKPEHFEFTAKTDSPHLPQPAQRPSLDAPSFRTLVAEPASTGRTPVADQVAVQIHRAVQGKINNMTVMLEPESLGKIDVRLDFFGDNRVHAHILTDRPETLEMMQRDVRVIERALTNAGLETGSNGLQFSLRDQQNGRQQGFGNQTDQNQSPATSDETTPEPVIYSLRPMDGTRLDIRI